MIDTETATQCECVRCTDERAIISPTPLATPANLAGLRLGFRYACELCGNKRCPHHADHQMKCTESNEVDQIGVPIETETAELLRAAWLAGRDAAAHEARFHDYLFRKIKSINPPENAP